MRERLIVFTFLAIQLACAICLGQTGIWTKTNGPYGISTELLFQNSSVVLFKAYNALTYRSKDKGEHWEKTESLHGSITAMGGNDSVIFASLYFEGLSCSRDGGLTWQRDSIHLP